jgi:hypothetical protein
MDETIPDIGFSLSSHWWQLCVFSFTGSDSDIVIIPSYIVRMFTILSVFQCYYYAIKLPNTQITPGIMFTPNINLSFIVLSLS